ncbi:MAG: ABC transporter permease [Pirellulales bacterium]|nr:ABC transporter permease [Pirellulales bacterium]
MGLDVAHYHGWHGKLHSPWWSCLAIMRVGLLQVFRRKSYWVVLGLGLLNFILYWAIIYAVTQFEIPRDAQETLLRGFGFSSQPSGDEESGYIQFMQRQSIVVMILLAFSGSLLVGSDFRLRSLPFYLSRRIDRRHYIVGKLLAVSAIVMILTVLPALVLFVEYGLFTSSTKYWIDNWRIPVSVVVYGLVLCVVLSILITTLSAYLQRVAPIAITWSSVFVLFGSISQMLEKASDPEYAQYWRLLDPWRDMRAVGRLCFGSFNEQIDVNFAYSALIILTVVCSISLLLLVQRVRAVDIVE